jgi:Family of unknown function (DUF6049)
MRRWAVALLVTGLAVLLTSLAPIATAAPNPVSRNWLRLVISSEQPRMVTANDTSVTINATITNISDRPIRQLTARIELGDAVTGTTALRASLSPTASYSHSDTVFTPVHGTLERGQSASFTVRADLQGAASLRVTRPGVYPLQLNVQGLPDYSTTVYRVGVASLLLPVLSVPGHTAPTNPPAQLTVLWPLVDQQPRAIGTADGQLVLTDDALAASLAPGGRLFGLVDAVRQVATTSPDLLSALCFAVDPDLLATVQEMAGGYRVASGGTTVAGQGTAAAQSWLAALKSLTAGHCVLALPYADADLTALAHADGTNLIQLALADGAAAVKSLGGQTLTDVVWPADNTLDTATMTDLAGFGVHDVLLNADSVTPQAAGQPVPLAGFTGGNAPKVVPVDPVVSPALVPRTDEPNVDATAVAAQDGLAAVVFQTVFGHSGGRPVLVAPPRRWSPGEPEALTFLRQTATVLAGHYATPDPLGDAVLATAAGGPATLNYSPQASLAEVTHSVATSAVTADVAQRDLLTAMSPDRTTPTPVVAATLIGPLRLDLLRAVSGAWRDGHAAGANTAMTQANGQFEALRQMVTVVQPGLPILLGSSGSRVPVTVTNKLPVDVTVRVDLTGEPGLPATGAGPQVVPAHGGVTMFIPITVVRSGRFSAYATAYTPGGTELGQQARLELSSSAYGTIIVIVTAIAFGLLVLLSGRRIYRRVRAAHAAAATETSAPDGSVAALVGVAAEPAAHGEQREPGEQ